MEIFGARSRVPDAAPGRFRHTLFLVLDRPAPDFEQTAAHLCRPGCVVGWACVTRPGRDFNIKGHPVTKIAKLVAIAAIPVLVLAASTPLLANGAGGGGGGGGAGGGAGAGG